MKMLKRAIVLSIAVGCFSMSVLAEPVRFYRYINTDGNQETSHTIPVDRVPLGYEVLDSQMRLIERVAPQLTPAEVAAKDRRDREVAQCVASQKRVRELYESEADITHAQEQALESLANRIGNAQANLAQLRTQKRDLEEEAARIDRAGQALTGVVLSNIDRARTQIANLEQEIAKRTLEKEETRRQHALDREIFRAPECLVASNTSSKAAAR